MFNFEFKEKKDYILLKLQGNLSIQTVENFKKVIDNDFDESCCNLVIDLQELVYIDSFGIGILFDLRKKIKKNSKELIIFGICYDISKVFELIGMNEIFNIVGNLEIAEKLISSKCSVE